MIHAAFRDAYLLTGGTKSTKRKTVIVARNVLPTGVVVALQRFMPILATGRGESNKIATTD